ncbi:MAG: sigma-70 family RNA polymerase sigma factor [Oscillospiraceae bacterium]|nr:sigma-70 family RNA polymerase sigma factor [Oscillospiraceae bacterium]
MSKFIYINSTAVSVTEEVYYTYHKMKRYEKTLVEKDHRNRLIHYDAWDDEFISKVPINGNLISTPEDIVVLKQTRLRLYQSLSLLPEAERDLIRALFFEGKSIAALSKQLKIPPRTIGYRRDRTLKNLREMMTHK